MGEYLSSILVIAATAIVVGLIFFLVNRKKKEKEALIIQLAQRNGWKYQKINTLHQNGYLLQDEGWSFECVATSSSNPSETGSSGVTYSNRWFSDRFISPNGLVMIGPKLPQLIKGAFAELLLQQAIKLLLGADSAEAAGLREVTVGRSAFQERFSVYALDESAAEKVLTFSVENALLNWTLKEKPVVKVLARGTEILLKDGRVEKPEEVEAVVVLGKAFLAS